MAPLLLLFAAGAVLAVYPRTEPCASRATKRSAATAATPGALHTPAALDQAQTEKIHPEEELLEELLLEDDIEVLAKFEELPDDPVETGPCSLTLNLKNAESGQPVQASIQLWRLDAPGNEHWRRGDQLQARLDVPVEGLAVDNLPAGRYRIFGQDQRINSEDPAALEVAGPKTVVTLSLPMPRKFHVYVRIYTESGHLLMRAMRCEAGVSSSSRSPAQLPKWRKRRALKGLAPSRGIARIRACGGGSGPTYEVVGTERGFDLGYHSEDSRNRSYRTSHHFDVEGRTSVSIHLTRDIQRNRTYMALCVPEDPILASIVLPDGRRAVDAGADIRIYCSAKLEEPDVTTVSQPQATGSSGDEEIVARPPARRLGKPRRVRPGFPPGAWRTLPIIVAARLDGFKTLVFKYRLGDPLPVRCLRPSRR